jgi:hypothetical protein
VQPLSLRALKKGVGNRQDTVYKNQRSAAPFWSIKKEIFLIANADKVLCCRTLAIPDSERPLSPLHIVHLLPEVRYLHWERCSLAAPRKSVRRVVDIKRAFFPTLFCRGKSPFSCFTKLLKETANIPFFVPVSLSDNQALSETSPTGADLLVDREKHFECTLQIQHEVFGVSVELMARVSRKRGFFAIASFSHNTPRSVCIARLGLLTARRLRYIKFPFSPGDTTPAP